jgi:hypothetical protein
LYVLCRDSSSSSSIVVKPAFSIAALAAVPVANGFSLPSSSSSSSSRELLDLLVLHPSGQLLLHRGSQRLITINLTLPGSCLQQLTSTAAAAAAAAGRQGQDLKGAAAAVVRGRPGTAGSLGCWSMSEGSAGGDESDDMLLSPGTSLVTSQKPSKSNASLAYEADSASVCVSLHNYL